MDAYEKLLDGLLQELENRRQANLKYSTEVRPGNIIPIEINLGTAQREFQLPSPFRAVWISDATDSEANVKLMLHTNTEGARRNAYEMKQPTALNFGRDVAQAWLTWEAQTYFDPTTNCILSKTMTLWVATDANIELGRNITVNPSSSVFPAFTQMDGTLLVTSGSVSNATAGTPFVIVGNNNAGAPGQPRCTTIVNMHATETIYLGDQANVENLSQATTALGIPPNIAFLGIPLEPGEKIVIRNKDSLYGVTENSFTDTLLLAIMTEY